MPADDSAKLFEENKSYKCVRTKGLVNAIEISIGCYYRVSDIEVEGENTQVILTVKDNDNEDQEISVLAFDVNDCLEDKAAGYDQLLEEKKSLKLQLEELAKQETQRKVENTERSIGFGNSPMNNAALQITFEESSEPEGPIFPGLFKSVDCVILAVSRNKDCYIGFVVSVTNKQVFYKKGQWRSDWIPSSFRQVKGKVTLEF